MLVDMRIREEGGANQLIQPPAEYYLCMTVDSCQHFVAELVTLCWCYGPSGLRSLLMQANCARLGEHCAPYNVRGFSQLAIKFSKQQQMPQQCTTAPAEGVQANPSKCFGNAL